MDFQLTILTRFPFPGFHRFLGDPFWAKHLVKYSVLATSAKKYDFHVVVLSSSALLGPSWAICGNMVDFGVILGCSWASLGALLGSLGGDLGHVGGFLEPSWGHLGEFGGYLEPSYG